MFGNYFSCFRSFLLALFAVLIYAYGPHCKFTLAIDSMFGMKTEEMVHWSHSVIDHILITDGKKEGDWILF